MARRNKQDLAGVHVTGIGWADTNQACAYAGVTKPTLDKWLRQGLRHSRIGRLVRIKYTDIDDFLRRHEVGATDDLAGIALQAMRLL